MASLRCLVAFAFILVSSPTVAQPRVSAGQAVAVAGVAAIVRAQSRTPLRQGTMVNFGDRIITGANARVRVRLIDGATLVVGPRSEIVVRTASTSIGRRSISLRLIFGIARAIAPPNHRSALEIWTSAAIASVRHTDWIVVVRSDRTAVLAVEGAVDVTDRRSGKRNLLRKGQGIDLLTSGQHLGPRLWPAARIDRLLAATKLP